MRMINIVENEQKKKQQTKWMKEKQNIDRE